MDLIENCEEIKLDLTQKKNKNNELYLCACRSTKTGKGNQIRKLTKTLKSFSWAEKRQKTLPNK